MHVLVCPADAGGCGHYRLIWPAQILKEAGLDVTVESESVIRTTVIRGRGMVSAHLKVPADVLVIQRPLQRTLCEAIPFLQRQGVRIVVEVDDDFSTIHRHNPAWYTSHPKADPNRNFHWLKEACRRADLVTVSTPRLAQVYGSHGRVAVLPNYVPESYLKVQPPAHEQLRVGWSGSVATHLGDLDVTRGAVQRALQASGAVMTVVGTGSHVRGALRIPEGQELLTCGWVPIHDYPLALAEFDVGIVPLAQTQFNEAKSWLKGLEMAAVGVPFLASPTQQYSALAAEGMGVLVRSPKEWQGALRNLLASSERRADLAGAARDAAGSFTIEGHADLWWRAWCSARN